jgi:hypothetical protein
MAWGAHTKGTQRYMLDKFVCYLQTCYGVGINICVHRQATCASYYSDFMMSQGTICWNFILIMGVMGTKLHEIYEQLVEFGGI